MKLIALIVLLYCPFSFCSESLTTDNFNDVFNKLQQKSDQYGRQNVLLVLDIDNTLLASDDLGSDHWFNWQNQLITQGNCEPLCITKNFDKLVEYQGLIWVLSRMNPTEPSLPPRINLKQKLGHKIILLTSRSPEFRNITEKSLLMNNYNFKVSAIHSETSYPITEDDLKNSGIEIRPVSYENGVFMTTGLHKGNLLKLLLKKLKTNYKAIIFVDDQQKHVERVMASLGEDLDLSVMRYSKVDPQVKHFRDNNKYEVTERWYKLKKALKASGFEL